MPTSVSFTPRIVPNHLAPSRDGTGFVDSECCGLYGQKRIDRAATVTEYSLSFGPFQLNPTRRILLRDGKPLRLGSRALDLLIALVDNGKDLISKEDLLKRVWPDTFIEEANLRVHVAALRKLLGDEGTGDQYISTVAGRGYCFVAPVARVNETAGNPLSAPSP